MNRLAALIEKSGMPHDRVLSPEEMAAAIPNPDTYYFAHDYAATSLARFFSLAAAETQPLNQQERDLLALLVGAHVIERATRSRDHDVGAPLERANLLVHRRAAIERQNGQSRSLGVFVDRFGYLHR